MKLSELKKMVDEYTLFFEELGMDTKDIEVEFYMDDDLLYIYKSDLSKEFELMALSFSKREMEDE